MKYAQLVNTRGSEKTVFASTLATADNFCTRSKGLLGRSTFSGGEGLWIKRCNSIHTFFMRFAIDAVFVDDNLKVVSMYHSLKPWRLTRLHLKASSVFELPAGTLQQHPDLRAGDQLVVEHGGQHE